LASAVPTRFGAAVVCRNVCIGSGGVANGFS
jgi:hypothetical protein